ncbi:MAG TPA: Mur ligase domain-containing protein, partial [Saprospiraceae bacterium]|nr:Mur ligase domain-containing protein [Saprospiraceae bacterium]
MNVGGYKHVYFVGIGGIGMSALARYFIIRNVKVSGYDKTETALTRKLVGEGIDITYEDNKEHLSEDIDLVVYTPAVPKELGILKALESREVPVVKRAKLLGIISEQARTIAIAGTHGKTTTTSLVAHCL